MSFYGNCFSFGGRKCLLGINSTKVAAGVNWHFFKLNLTTFCNRKLITLNYN